MPNPTTNKPAPNMETTLKTLWGASRWPGFAESTVVFEQPGAQKALKRLEQMISVQSCGLLHGPHGVGKTYLVHRLIGSLPDKKYRIHRISHSSLMCADSGRNRPPIPISNRPGIPIQFGHPFRSKSATYSGPNKATLEGLI